MPAREARKVRFAWFFAYRFCELINGNPRVNAKDRFPCNSLEIRDFYDIAALGIFVGVIGSDDN